ncbi:piwi domain protein [Ostertagia ostertagi]
MADQLSGGMGKLSVASVALPEKRAPGSIGTKLDFVTNLTSIKLKPNVPYYKYDVRMYIVYKGNDGREVLKELTKQTKDDFPEQERKMSAVAVYKHLVKSYKDIFPQDGQFFYDRAAVLFSAQKEMKLGGPEKIITLPANLAPAAGSDATGIRVVIKKVTDGYQVTSNDLMKAVNVRDCERDKGILEVLNLAVSQKGYMETSQFVTYGTGVHYLYDHRALGFRDNELPDLMDGKYMGIGLTKAVKVLEGDQGKSASAFVVTDVTKGAFHIDEQNLLEKISRMSIFFDPRTGLYVRTTCSRKRTFPIGNLAAAANALKLQTSDGVQCTIEQYFKKQYNVQLKYPGLFTVSERHNPHNYYPVELLTVAPSQRVTLQQQTPDQVASMIKASATLPSNRLHQTKVMKEALEITPRNAQLASAGINIENGFTTVPGRVLPTPTILYGGSQTLKPVDNCKWNGDRSRFLEPAQLTNWAVCATLTQNDARRLQIKDYVARVESRCRAKGMQVESAAEIFTLTKQNFDGLREFYAAQKKKGRKYLLFITSDAIKQHDLIKLLEVEYQIVSQEVKGSKVDSVMFKNQNQTLDNVIAKINMKLGGINYNVVLGSKPNDPASKWLSDRDRLFVGFEISNPPALSKLEIERGATYKMPSVLGWGANCAANPQHYIGDYVFIKPRQSDMMGAKLSELIVEILKKFRGATSIAPRHIVLYFSGISEGQFSLVTDTYMKAINTGITSLSANYRPSNISGNRANEQNIPPGTVVDTKIVSPVINEFYLNSHSAFQGTAKTPKYSLLADDSKIPLDVIEGMTHGLCYLHEIVTSTVSVPVPLIVADRCAKRGHNIFIANSNQGSAAVNSIEEANEKLVNHGELEEGSLQCVEAFDIFSEQFTVARC